MPTPRSLFRLARHASRFAIGALLGPVAALAILAGCQSGNRTTTDGDAETGRLPAIEAMAAQAEAEPLGIGQAAGIEVHWWMVDDANAAVARALSSGALADLLGSGSAAEPSEFEPEALASWRTSGLRVYSLPPGSFAPLQRRLPPRQAWERLWLGQPAVWRELVGGRTLRRGELIQADGITLPVPPGRLRLLVRAWLTPGAAGPAMHFELLPQIAQRNPALTFDPNREVETISELNAGRVFETLHLRARLTPGRVYVIVPAAPDEDWDAAVRAADRARERAPSSDGATESAASQPDPILREPAYEVPEGPIGPTPDLIDLSYGPDDRGPLSLGEAAFHIDLQRGDDDTGPAARRRLIIVILVRSPARFGLLP